MEILEIETPAGQARAHLRSASEPQGALVLGHGASVGVDSPDLVVASDVAVAGRVTVALVEQPYWVAGRRSPPPIERLEPAWNTVVEHLVADGLRDLPLIVGGRSLGARVACRTATQLGAVAVLCLAFPFQPPQRRGAPTPPQSRVSELDQVEVPTLVVQGNRDPFGIPPEGPSRNVVQVPGGHGLKKDLDAVGAAVREWLPGVVDRAARTAAAD